MADYRDIPIRSDETAMAAHSNIMNSNNQNPYINVTTIPTSPANYKIRLGSNPADAAMARLVEGTKVLTYGGYDRVFENTFGIMQGEKLLKQYACYISTSTGPSIGTLYISTKRLAFCSDYALRYYPVSPHNSQSIYYKVVVPIEQLSRVSPCSSKWNPSEKYIEVVTVDGSEFTFMGFMAYDKALNTLSEAFQRRTHSTGN
ncbi:GEM-like protein 1 isoform X2 [Prosopis cineraria]|uniref:GEM-like protein 1 isoform X2 n=1 Tax=Prosopis cineraria TaxID=364024 RepID=UPI00240F45C8|nr:GEM-like protein 1 isoform X2 [Prosopis cineraria]